MTFGRERWGDWQGLVTDSPKSESVRGEERCGGSQQVQDSVCQGDGNFGSDIV
jgi:hypothetical protein